MTKGHDSDEWLMGQVALGKRELLAPLVRRYSSPLLTFIERMVGDRHRAEELFQEVFLAVWVKRKQYRFPRTFRSWLFTIARNTVTDTWRRQRPQTSLDPSIDTLMDCDPGPEALAIAGDEYAALCAVLDSLPETQRAIVELRLAGLTTREIMSAMDMTEAAVKSAQTRAYRRLRDIVPPEGFMS